MTAVIARVLALTIPVLLLTGCAVNGGSSHAGGTTGTSEGSALDCSSIHDPDYKLFTDPRLSIAPEKKVYPLVAKKDAVSFTDTGTEGVFTTYSYTFSYIDKGKVFPNDAAIFVGAEHTGTFTMTAPQSPGGVTGGPYAGFLDIEATTDAGTTVIARLCVAFAKG
jgi:hypothetical protein